MADCIVLVELKQTGTSGLYLISRIGTGTVADCGRISRVGIGTEVECVVQVELVLGQ